MKILAKAERVQKCCAETQYYAFYLKLFLIILILENDSFKHNKQSSIEEIFKIL